MLQDKEAGTPPHPAGPSRHTPHATRPPPLSAPSPGQLPDTLPPDGTKSSDSPHVQTTGYPNGESYGSPP